MNRDELDLDELEKLCTELDIGGVMIQEYPWVDAADITLSDSITVESAQIDEARKLMVLFKALPRLIELARAKQEGEG